MKPTSPVLPCNSQYPETVIAKDQPEYLPLPSAVVRRPDGAWSTWTRWELTEEEVQKLLSTRSIYLEVLTFGEPLQPLFLCVDEPFSDMELRECGHEKAEVFMEGGTLGEGVSAEMCPDCGRARLISRGKPGEWIILPMRLAEAFNKEQQKD